MKTTSLIDPAAQHDPEERRDLHGSGRDAAGDQDDERRHPEEESREHHADQGAHQTGDAGDEEADDGPDDREDAGDHGGPHEGHPEDDGTGRGGGGHATVSLLGCRGRGSRDGLAMRRQEGDDEAGRDADESERDADEVVARPLRLRADVHQQECEAHDRGPGVEDQHGVAVGVAHVQHPVMEVLAIRRERRLALAHPSDDRESEVEQRQEHHDHREQDRDERAEQLGTAELVVVADDRGVEVCR